MFRSELSYKGETSHVKIILRIYMHAHFEIVVGTLFLVIILKRKNSGIQFSSLTHISGGS